MGFRLEDKIKFHISDYLKIKNEIRKNNGKILHPKRLVSSLYFDNKNLDMFIDSEEGNVPRKKIRYRSYPEENKNNFYFEKKINSAEAKYKKSSEKNTENFEQDIKNGILEPGYGLIEVKIKVSYYREYYLVDGTRLTLDYHINYSSPDGYNSKNDRESLILEVKSSDKIIEVQNKFLNTIPFRRERFSKYCEGINALYNKDHYQRLNNAI
jgi:SPX domain protein involved in polyphosphate accumulation